MNNIATLLFVTGMELNINWTLTLSFQSMQYRLTSTLHLILCLSKLQVPNVDQQYNLIAVINHRGAMSGGHCESRRECYAFSHLSQLDVAVCKRGDSWFCFNDLSVTSCRDRNFVVS